jgi:lipopolysaccharide/colanic/teichoic acid biosynthesis glycosyltransferase
MFIKRTIDFIASCILIVMSAPIFLIITILIKISSKGPVFFRQERVGYQGKIFNIWKFRTMRQENSESEHRDIIQGLLQKEEHIDGTDLLTQYITYIDSRTTKIGRFLRATSLDELPQLFNIFTGDMSLVGPRPHPLYEVEEYKKWYHRRLAVKPGLTGWSKLNLRCTPQNYEEAILYDLWYVDHWNLILDLRILFMTIPFVLMMKDAH